MSKKSVKKPDYAKFEANRAVKKKNKKKKTTAIVSSVIAACIFIIAAIVAVNVLSPSVTAELTSSAWVPEGAKNASGDEVEMSEVYNTNYSAYQGSMSFSDDGTLLYGFRREVRMTELTAENIPCQLRTKSICHLMAEQILPPHSHKRTVKFRLLCLNITTMKSHL